MCFLLGGELAAGFAADTLDDFSVFEMLILTLLCFSLKVAEVPLSESGHLVPWWLTSHTSAKYPYKSMCYKHSKIAYNDPYKKDPSFNFT